MLRYLFAFVILVHGLIHLMGFAKAFGYAELPQLTREISKPAGLSWLLACLLCSTAVAGFLLKKDWWPMLALVAVIVSQVVIIWSWQDAKIGTVANILLLLVALAGFTNMHFETGFKKDVQAELIRSAALHPGLVTQADTRSLPQPVQRYLAYTGVLNKPGLKNVRVVFEGEMRSKKRDWFGFESVQYNFFDEPARLFFMKARMFGIMVPGYHRYRNRSAIMDIRLFGLFPVAQASGAEMTRAETVTLFNDMCLVAPASLTDQRIQWEVVDSLTAKAVFTNGDIKIAAVLYFSAGGQLVNFISDDRYDVNIMEKLRFSTPVHEYKNVNGINVVSDADAVWHYPEGKFIYGKFRLKSISYNVEKQE